MTDAELLALQFSLQRIGVDADGCLVRLPGPNPDGLPRVYCATLSGVSTVYFGAGVPRTLCQQLGTLTLDQIRDDGAAVCAILAQQAPCGNVWRGCSAVVTRAIGGDEHPDVRALHPEVAEERALLASFDAEVAGYGWPVYAVMRDGRVVSACVSSREDERGGEAWVQTLPEARGRGYARQTTAAWAHALQDAGKLPFYSFSDDNVASAGVASSLGLRVYLRDVGYL
ncbi:MAG TPA: GNAT family N-acetyltransferase [Chloroflexota bacterium]